MQTAEQKRQRLATGSARRSQRGYSPRRAAAPAVLECSSMPPPVPWSHELVIHIRQMMQLHGTKQPTRALQTHYIDDAVRVFRYVYDAAGGGSAHIPYQYLNRISKHSREILTDLYNANLIYFSLGSRGCRSHGHDRKRDVYFPTRYQLSKGILVNGDLNIAPRPHNRLRNGGWRDTRPKYTKAQNLVRHSPLYMDILGLDTSHADTLSPVEREALCREVRRAWDGLRHGAWLHDETHYTHLMFDDGTPFKCEVPRLGHYEDGRYYNALSCLERSRRKHLLYDGRPLVQLFDQHCCYMSLVAAITGDPDLTAIIRHGDIYADCLQWMHLSCTRDDIKPYFQKYLLATNRDLKHAMLRRTPANDPALMTAVYSYMQIRFPRVHAWVTASPTIPCFSIDRSMSLRRRPVKTLVHVLQAAERTLIDYLRSLCIGVTFTVHDSILSPDPAANALLDLPKMADALLYNGGLTAQMSDTVKAALSWETTSTSKVRHHQCRLTRHSADFIAA